MARTPWAIGTLGFLIVCFVFVALLVVHETELPRVTRPNVAQFPATQVDEGARLAAIGDCVVCHTATGGTAFTGGRPLATPFGTLYSTNITPDDETGIGQWSADAFRRAMTRGIARDGTHLYPALPYEHFTHVAQADLEAIYAFLMTRPPQQARTPANKLIFPLGFRPLLAGWNLLFLHPGPIPVDTSRSTEWNRGAYLVEGLGHCGGCHTPRNLAGGEERGRLYAGGVAEGWNAPALDSSNASPVPWTVDALVTYLRAGVEGEHGVAGGPMGPVTHGLSEVAETDVRAIATYVVSRMDVGRARSPAQEREQAADAAQPAGGALFAGGCGGCHAPGAPMLARGAPSLATSGDLRHADPRNAILAILQGISPPVTRAGPLMPPFADALTDAQVADLMAYLRLRFGDGAPWVGLPKAVAAARKEAGEP